MRGILFVVSFCAWSSVLADDPASVPTPQTAAAPALAAAISTASSPTSAAPLPAVASAPQLQPAKHAEITCADIKVFKDKTHAAIDAALKYPAELRFKPATGVTIVAYNYATGHVSNVHITQWSGDGRLDRAALNAVKQADYASITPDIGAHKFHDSVIIIFDNSADAEKNDAEYQKTKRDPASGDCSS